MRDEIKQCPLYSKYRFKTHCKINTCKFYTPVTQNRCLGLDIKFSAEDKQFSDAELLRYKFFDQGMDIRDVSKVKKRAIENVKNILQLHQLILRIIETFGAETDAKIELEYSSAVEEVINSPPIPIEIIGFEPWMLKYMLDEKYVEKTLGKKFKLQHALGLSKKQYSALKTEVLEKMTHKGGNHAN